MQAWLMSGSGAVVFKFQRQKKIIVFLIKNALIMFEI